MACVITGEMPAARRRKGEQSNHHNSVGLLSATLRMKGTITPSSQVDTCGMLLCDEDYYHYYYWSTMQFRTQLGNSNIIRAACINA